MSVDSNLSSFFELVKPSPLLTSKFQQVHEKDKIWRSLPDLSLNSNSSHQLFEEKANQIRFLNNLKTGKCVQKKHQIHPFNFQDCHDYFPRDLCTLLPDNTLLSIRIRNTSVFIDDLSTKVRTEIKSAHFDITSFYLKDSLLIIGDFLGKFTIIDLEMKKNMGEIQLHDGYQNVVEKINAISFCNTDVACATHSGRIFIYDFKKKQFHPPVEPKLNPDSNTPPIKSDSSPFLFPRSDISKIEQLHLTDRHLIFAASRHYHQDIELFRYDRNTKKTVIFSEATKKPFGTYYGQGLNSHIADGKLVIADPPSKKCRIWNYENSDPTHAGSLIKNHLVNDAYLICHHILLIGTRDCQFIAVDINTLQELYNIHVTHPVHQILKTQHCIILMDNPHNLTGTQFTVLNFALKE